MTDVSPSDAIEDSEVTESDGLGAGDSEESDSISLTDLLMETEPADDPSNYSLDDSIAHYIIAGKKMMHSAGASVKEGTTALENIIRGSIGLFSGRGDDSDAEESEEVEVA